MRRRIAISDIHGTYSTFKKLVEDKIILSKEDELYLLGDMFDGPRVMKLLNYIIKLKDEGFKVFTLLGNHEHQVLKDISNGRRKLQEKYHLLLKESKFFVEFEDVVLVHAGFNMSLEYPPEDKQTMMWTFHWTHNGTNPWLGSRRVIHGHAVQPLENIETSIREKHLRIDIDNGVKYPEDPKKGNLVAFDFQNWNYWVQPNIDML